MKELVESRTKLLRVASENPICVHDAIEITGIPMSSISSTLSSMERNGLLEKTEFKSNCKRSKRSHTKYVKSKDKTVSPFSEKVAPISAKIKKKRRISGAKEKIIEYLENMEFSCTPEIINFFDFHKTTVFDIISKLLAEKIIGKTFNKHTCKYSDRLHRVFYISKKNLRKKKKEDKSKPEYSKKTEITEEKQSISESLFSEYRKQIETLKINNEVLKSENTLLKEKIKELLDKI
jgi:DNA-binding transcriptional regulator GbsR (MarR family)